jgi:hypothetical protein
LALKGRQVAVKYPGVQPFRTMAGRAKRTIANPLKGLKIEAPPRHFAGVIPRQTSSANIRPHAVDRACRGDAYLSYKRHTAITAASHASQVAIDIRVGDSIEIGVAFE